MKRRKVYIKLMKAGIMAEAVFLLLSGVILLGHRDFAVQSFFNQEKKDFIKWVDFDVTGEAMAKAYEYDVDTHGTKKELHWIELLSYLGCVYGGDFSRYKNADMEALAEKLTDQGLSMEELTADMKYYDYYLEAYTAVLGGLVGEYEIELPWEGGSGEKILTKKYGLKGFSPIAKGFPYSDFDDFGVSRSYGYRRTHLGHDMMGQIGTPIAAVESGYVEALGWNQYGGWRMGIRSFDGRRYYYYAHLRQNFPYAKHLKVGSAVTAGDIIGYMGHTGYSAKENVNNIDTVHLHFGLQLIFDESQREGNGEIWVSCYELTRFLSRNRTEAVKDPATKEWRRVYAMRDPAVENRPAFTGSPDPESSDSETPDSGSPDSEDPNSGTPDSAQPQTRVQK